MSDDDWDMIFSDDPEDDYRMHHAVFKDDIEKHRKKIEDFVNKDTQSILLMKSAKIPYFKDIKESVDFLKKQIEFEVNNGKIGLDLERYVMRNCLRKLKDLKVNMFEKIIFSEGREVVVSMIQSIESIESHLRSKRGIV